MPQPGGGHAQRGAMDSGNSSDSYLSMVDNNVRMDTTSNSNQQKRKKTSRAETTSKSRKTSQPHQNDTMSASNVVLESDADEDFSPQNPEKLDVAEIVKRLREEQMSTLCSSPMRVSSEDPEEAVHGVDHRHSSDSRSSADIANSGEDSLPLTNSQYPIMRLVIESNSLSYATRLRNVRYSGYLAITPTVQRVMKNQPVIAVPRLDDAAAESPDGTQEHLPIKCPDCHFWFENLVTRDQHYRRNHDRSTMPYHCSVCQWGFLEKESLTQHMATAHQKSESSKQFEDLFQKYRCDGCGKPMRVKKKDLEIQLSIANISINCVECRMKHSKKMAVKRPHQTEIMSPTPVKKRCEESKKASPTKDTRVAICPLCKKLFLERKKRDVHYREKHGNDSMPLHCPICYQGFLEKPILIHHCRRSHGLSKKSETVQELMRNIENIEINEDELYVEKTEWEKYKAEKNRRTSEKLDKNVKVGVDMVNDTDGNTLASSQEEDPEDVTKSRSRVKSAVTCPSCNMIFGSRKLRLRHFINIHGESALKYQCQQCPRSFIDQCAIKTHCQKIHHIDSARFQHMYREDIKSVKKGDSSDEEDIHPVSLPPPSALDLPPDEEEEMDEESDSNEPQLLIASQQSSLTDILSHAAAEIETGGDDNEKMWQCKKCGKGFKDAERLKMHRKHYHKQEPVDCPICNEKFTSSNPRHQRYRHFISVHGESAMSVTCRFCPKRFIDRHALFIHSQKAHQIKKPAFDELYGKSSHSEETDSSNKLPNVGEQVVRRHSDPQAVNPVKSPARVLALPCDTCNETFMCKKTLERHIRTVHHEKGMPYHCGICGKGFNHLKSLEKHKQTMHKARKALMKGFFTGGSSILPSKSFASQKCPTCGKVFQDEASRDLHCRTIHGDASMPFQCPICSRGYFHRAILLEHVHHQHKVKRDSKEMKKVIEQIGEDNSNDQAGGDSQSSSTDTESSLALGVKRKCPRCVKEFTDETSRDTHFRAVHGNANMNFHCEHCYKGFLENSSCIKHVQKIHEATSQISHLPEQNAPIVQNEKKHLFPSEMNKKELKEFVDAAMNEIKNGTIKCPTCSLLITVKTMTSHSLSHGNRTGFQCTLCHIEKPAPHDLLLHYMEQHGFEKYSEKMVHLFENLDLRKSLSSSKITPLTQISENLSITDKQKVFIDQISLAYTNLPPSTKTTCSYCSVSYEDEYARDDHFRRVHDKNIMPYSCSICHKGFFIPYTLLRHCQFLHSMDVYSKQILKMIGFYKTELGIDDGENLLSETWWKHLDPEWWEKLDPSELVKVVWKVIKRMQVDKILRCPLCPSIFMDIDVSQREYHFSTMHGEKLKPFSCPSCKTKFIEPTAWLSHCGNAHNIKIKSQQLKDSILKLGPVVKSFREGFIYQIDPKHRSTSKSETKDRKKKVSSAVCSSNSAENTGPSQGGKHGHVQNVLVIEPYAPASYKLGEQNPTTFSQGVNQIIQDVVKQTITQSSQNTVIGGSILSAVLTQGADFQKTTASMMTTGLVMTIGSNMTTWRGSNMTTTGQKLSADTVSVKTTTVTTTPVTSAVKTSFLRTSGNITTILERHLLMQKAYDRVTQDLKQDDNRCRKCKSVFKSALQRDKHYANEHNDSFPPMPIQCPICLVGFLFPYTLITHMHLVHKLYRYSKMILSAMKGTQMLNLYNDKLIETILSLDVHSASISITRKPLTKKQLDEMYKRELATVLTDLQELHASEASREDILFTVEEVKKLSAIVSIYSGGECLLCSKDFETGEKLRLHYKTVHADVFQPLECVICKDSFMSVYDLLSHYCSHEINQAIQMVLNLGRTLLGNSCETPKQQDTTEKAGRRYSETSTQSRTESATSISLSSQPVNVENTGPKPNQSERVSPPAGLISDNESVQSNIANVNAATNPAVSISLEPPNDSVTTSQTQQNTSVATSSCMLNKNSNSGNEGRNKSITSMMKKVPTSQKATYHLAAVNETAKELNSGNSGASGMQGSQPEGQAKPSQNTEHPTKEFEQLILTLLRRRAASAIKPGKDTSMNPLQNVYTCPWCEEVYITKDTRDKHFMDRHGALNSVYYCTKCAVGFLEPNDKMNHDFMIHGYKINCTVVTHLLRAVRNLLDPTPCRLCDHVFESLKQKLTHYRDKHPQEVKYKCVCQVSFADEEQLLYHAVSMHVSGVYKMTTLAWIDNTLKQEKQYTSKFGDHCSVYPCPSCIKPYCDMEELVEHYNRVHTTEPTPFIYDCFFCPERFVSHGAMHYHIEDNHHDKRTPYNCKDCGAGFTLLYSLRRHSNICKSNGGIQAATSSAEMTATPSQQTVPQSVSTNDDQIFGFEELLTPSTTTAAEGNTPSPVPVANVSAIASGGTQTSAPITNYSTFTSSISPSTNTTNTGVRTPNSQLSLQDIGNTANAQPITPSNRTPNSFGPPNVEVNSYTGLVGPRFSQPPPLQRFPHDRGTLHLRIQPTKPPALTRMPSVTNPIQGNLRPLNFSDNVQSKTVSALQQALAHIPSLQTNTSAQVHVAAESLSSLQNRVGPCSGTDKDGQIRTEITKAQAEHILRQTQHLQGQGNSDIVQVLAGRLNKQIMSQINSASRVANQQDYRQGQMSAGQTRQPPPYPASSVSTDSWQPTSSQSTVTQNTPEQTSFSSLLSAMNRNSPSLNSSQQPPFVNNMGVQNSVSHISQPHDSSRSWTATRPPLNNMSQSNPVPQMQASSRMPNSMITSNAQIGNISNVQAGTSYTISRTSTSHVVSVSNPMVTGQPNDTQTSSTSGTGIISSNTSTCMSAPQTQNTRNGQYTTSAPQSTPEMILVPVSSTIATSQTTDHIEDTAPRVQASVETPTTSMMDSILLLNPIIIQPDDCMEPHSDVDLKVEPDTPPKRSTFNNAKDPIIINSQDSEESLNEQDKDVLEPLSQTSTSLLEQSAIPHSPSAETVPQSDPISDQDTQPHSAPQPEEILQTEIPPDSETLLDNLTETPQLNIGESPQVLSASSSTVPTSAAEMTEASNSALSSSLPHHSSPEPSCSNNQQVHESPSGIQLHRQSVDLISELSALESSSDLALVPNAESSTSAPVTPIPAFSPADTEPAVDPPVTEHASNQLSVATEQTPELDSTSQEVTPVENPTPPVNLINIDDSSSDSDDLAIIESPTRPDGPQVAYGSVMNPGQSPSRKGTHGETSSIKAEVQHKTMVEGSNDNDTVDKRLIAKAQPMHTPEKSSGSDCCAVCGDKAFGLLNGALTCWSCQSFYEQCKETGVTSCTKKSAGQCDIISAMESFNCHYCRYQKCLSVMTKEKPPAGKS